MHYQILARKWRPQYFKDIIGQESIVQALSNSLTLNRIHHAWLFSGTRGIGKTTLARVLAKSLNCITGITDIPCRKCKMCQDIEKGSCLDFIEIDAASRTKVEDIKEILDNIYYAPATGRFKIYLIDEVHMLSRHSFNAFLKTLEEPPQHVKFIFATTNIDKIPKTIISRCIFFNLNTISEENIVVFLKKILQKEKIKSENEALNIIAYNANGSMRDALNLIEQAIIFSQGNITVDYVIKMLGIPSTEQIFSLTYALLTKDIKNIMLSLYEINEKQIIWEQVLIEMLNFLHHIAMKKKFPLVWKNNILKHYENKINNIIQNLNYYEIQICYKILLNGRKELSFAPSPKIGVEMSILRALTQIIQ